MSLEDTSSGANLIANLNSKGDGNEHVESNDNLVSSTNMTDDNNIIIVEESYDPSSITGILNACKKRILKPYLRFLSLMGLRPLLDQQRPLAAIINYGYTFQVVSFLMIGYFLQYSSCFRRDRGFGRLPNTYLFTRTELRSIYDETCNDTLPFTFIIPNLLHFFGYLYALIVFRTSDDDQLLILIERVFLLSSHVSNVQLNQKHIVRSLWFFIIASCAWMLSSTAFANYMMSQGGIEFKWLELSPVWIHTLLKVLLVVCTVWHDIIQASVISNYCLEAQLLTAYVHFLKEKLLEQNLRCLEWIREVEEFKRLLAYLNEKIMPPVCIFTIISWTYAISGTLWILERSRTTNTDDILYISTSVNILNVLLWWVIAIAPFIQAARLTIACEEIRTAGQEVRTRTFVYHDAPIVELNSILIYTSSLKINAKLFNLPINGKYVGIICAIVVVYFMVVGQNHSLPK